MKEFFKLVKTDKIINRTFISSCILIFLTFIYVAIRFFSLPAFVPVFNQLPWGNDRAAPRIFIFIPLFASIIILAVNLVLSSYIYGKSPLLSRIFSVTALLSAFLILIFSFVIINLIS